MFRKVFSVVGMLMLVSGLCGAAAQNLLKNPDFDDVISRQSIENWETVGGDRFESWSKEFHSGTASVKFWWDALITQKVTAIPGKKYELSGWLSNPLSEPLDSKGSKSGRIKMEFLSKDLTVLATVQSAKFDRTMEAGRWYEVKVIEIAPPNTAFVTATFQLFPGDGSGVILVDDMKLVIAKEVKADSSDKSIKSKKAK